MNAKGILRKSSRIILFAGILCLSNASAMDLFGVDASVPASPADSALIPHGAHPCQLAPSPTTPLSFDEAIERSLCTNPRTSEAWANIRLQASRVGISKSAWLPTLTMTLERIGNDVDTAVPGARQLNSGGLQVYSSQELVFNWTLLNAGRGFDIASSESTLEASKANQAEVLLSLFSDASHDYYAAQSASAALGAAIALEATAQSSYEAAHNRTDGGVAPISDALQAKTALAEAQLTVARARGELRSATGLLAWRIGLRPDTKLILPVSDERVLAAPPSLEAIESLITRVIDEHPHTLQAEHQLDAARARAQQARAELLPTVSLNMRMAHDSKPVAAYTGSNPFDARSRYRSASISVSVPLFDGSASSYRIDQADRSIDIERAQLEEARKQVASDAWLAWQTIQTAYVTFQQSQQLLTTAEASLAAARERYSAGVGTIGDLLNAQAALTSAFTRKQVAVSEYRSANAALWAKLGRMADS